MSGNYFFLQMYCSNRCSVFEDTSGRNETLSKTGLRPALRPHHFQPVARANDDVVARGPCQTRHFEIFWDTSQFRSHSSVTSVTWSPKLLRWEELPARSSWMWGCQRFGDVQKAANGGCRKMSMFIGGKWGLKFEPWDGRGDSRIWDNPRGFLGDVWLGNCWVVEMLRSAWRCLRKTRRMVRRFLMHSTTMIKWWVEILWF